ncbi:MAG: shikimate dehydrogenase [Dehalococcoidia bacterium]
MTRLAGIIGHPVAHSLSPVFQGAAFAHCGLDVRYELWETTGDGLHARLTNLRGEQYLGANVTIPHKETVIPFLDELGGQSARVGAVNTIVNRGGRLFGFNTDGPGFVAALRNESHFDPAGRSFILLGAGGAARGIAFALAESRAERVDIANRGPHRASRLALATTEAGCDSHALPLDAPLARYDCIVNCTSLGMKGALENRMPATIEGAKPGALVVDIVYRPEATPLLAAARAAGHPTLGGLPMLVYQGALAFELWTGVTAPVDVMFEAAGSALANERQAPP